MDAIFLTLDQVTLADSVAEKAGSFCVPIVFQRFSDTETYVKLENPTVFEHKTVVIVQSTYADVNTHVIGTLFLMHELYNAGAQKVFNVIPYFGYARQEQSCVEGKPGCAQLVSQMFELAGSKGMLSVELHDPKIQNFFSIPIKDILLHQQIADHIKARYCSDVCLVAPDMGARERVFAIAQLIGAETMVFSKERYAKDKTKIVGLEGKCSSKRAIIIDDIISTGGTAISVAQALEKQGFEHIEGYFVHGVFAAQAMQKVDTSPFEAVFVSNSIPLPEKVSNKVKVFDISNVLVENINELLKKKVVEDEKLALKFLRSNVKKYYERSL